jgi:hypothetical protein
MTYVCWFSLHNINTDKRKRAKQNSSAREREGVRPRERERVGGAPERKELLRDGGSAMLVAATVEGM